jgi:hypothetical protein
MLPIHSLAVPVVRAFFQTSPELTPKEAVVVAINLVLLVRLVLVEVVAAPAPELMH